MEKALAIWVKFQDRVIGPAASLMLIGCTLLALAEIFRRYVMGLSFEWQQDAVTFFILSGVYLYFCISQRHDDHLSVTVIPEVLRALGSRSQRAAQIIGIVAYIISFLFLLFVVWWGVPEVVDSMRYETRTESLAFPMWPFLTILLMGFAFMAVTTLFQAYRAMRRLLGLAVADQPPAPQEMAD